MPGFGSIINPPAFTPKASLTGTDFESRFANRVEQERQRRATAGMDVGEGWASPEWLNQLRSEMLAADLQKRSDELGDPNSKYYTDYYKQLKGTLSAQSSLNSLLGLNRAMGLSMAGSATIANEQRTALEGKITDYAGTATQDFARGNIAQSNSLLGLGLQNTESLRDYYFKKQQYEDSKKFDWGSLAKTVGQFAALIPGPQQPFVMGANVALQAASSNINKNSQSSGYGTGKWYKDPISGQWKYGGG